MIYLKTTQVVFRNYPKMLKKRENKPKSEAFLNWVRDYGGASYNQIQDLRISRPLLSS